MREETEKQENTEWQEDEESGAGKPVAATEATLVMSLDEPNRQPSEANTPDLARLEGKKEPGLPVEAAATTDLDQLRFDGAPDLEWMAHQVGNSSPLGVWHSSKEAAKSAKDGAVALYIGLNPQDAIESIRCRLIVGGTNASMGCFVQAALCDQSPRARELNLRLGFQGSKVVDDLIKSLESGRGQGRAKVTVGNVNVEAGGQAIVGNIEPGRKSKPATRKERTRRLKRATNNPVRHD